MFIEEPSPADSLISHAQLQLEINRVNETRTDEWASFLERASARASLPSSDTDAHEDTHDIPRTFVGMVPIWNVPVKV